MNEYQDNVVVTGVKKVLDIFYMLTISIAAIGVLAIIVITLMQVISRYFSGESYVWVEELSRYLLIAATMSGVVAVCSKGDMIRIEYLLGRLNNRTLNLIVPFIIDCLIIIMLYYFVCESRVTVALNENIISTSMRFPLSYIYSIIYYAGILLFIVYVLRVVLKITDRGGR